jgi:hypothetical protein
MKSSETATTPATQDNVRKLTTPLMDEPIDYQLSILLRNAIVKNFFTMVYPTEVKTPKTKTA